MSNQSTGAPQTPVVTVGEYISTTLIGQLEQTIFGSLRSIERAVLQEAIYDTLSRYKIWHGDPFSLDVAGPNLRDLYEVFLKQKRGYISDWFVQILWRYVWGEHMHQFADRKLINFGEEKP